MRREGLFLAAALILLFAAMALKPSMLAIPDPSPSPTAGQFDTRRAIARLQRILGDERPHPVDSAASDAVRARLVAELRALGLSPVLTDRIGCNGVARSRTIGCARIRNVRATIGPAAGRHLLLVSHYDSTPVGPGAADDGIGIAVMLEIAASLKARPPARPVTFLFNEGEELQLNGARAFLEGDPIASRVDALINLEARGVTGPAIMFETSRPNRGAIDWFGRAAWHPVANSLTADFYALIPNDTDVTVFKPRGWTTLNFAIIGNESRYHSPGDTLAALDPRSVNHMGVQALRAVEAIPTVPPAQTGERIYASTPGGALVSLKRAFGLGLLGLLMAGAMFVAWSRRHELGRSAAVVVAGLAASGATVFIVQRAIALIRPGEFWRAHPELIGAAVDLAALAACTILLIRLGRGASREALRAAYWLIFLLFSAALCMLAPGAAIFFLLPPLLALAGMFAARRHPAAERLGAVAAWLVLFLSWAPLLHLSETLLDFDGAWLFAILSALILLPALIELKPVLERIAGMRRAGLIALPALCAWGAFLFLPAYSADRKQDFSIFHVSEGGSARWMVLNDGASLPAGFESFRPGAKVAWSRRRHWAAPAPAVAIAPPRIEPLGERPHPLGRLIRFRLRSAGTDTLLLRAEPDAALIAARAGGAIARFGRGKPDDPFQFRCNGRSCDGLVVDLLVGGPRPLAMKLIGFRHALPPAARPLVTARPAVAAPHYTPDAAISVTDIRL